MNNFVILGGGISGLSSAFFLRYFYPSAQITLIEASPRVGGMIQSHIDREYHYVAELGPRSIRKGAYMGPIYKILNDIGLYHDIVPAHTQKYAYIYTANRLLALPQKLSFQSIKEFSQNVGSQELWKLGKGFLRNQLRKRHLEQDVSVFDYLRETYDEDVLEKYVETVFYGIYGESIRELSAELCYLKEHMSDYKAEQVERTLPVSSEFRKQTEGLLQGMSSFRFTQGLEQLPRELQRYLAEKQCRILLRTSCEQVRFEEKRVRIRCDGQADEVPYDVLVLSLPSKEMVDLVGRSGMEIEYLKAMRFNTIVSANLFFDRKVLPEKFEGFGYLINPREGEPLLGAVMDSVTFPQLYPKESTHVSVMMREEQEDEVILKALERHLGSSVGKATRTSRKSWEKGFTVYEPHHRERLQKVQEELQKAGVMVSGSIRQSPAIPELVSQAYSQVLRMAQRME